jgi:hypothetical protein
MSQQQQTETCKIPLEIKWIVMMKTGVIPVNFTG